jgi:hypothetical protein
MISKYNITVVRDVEWDDIYKFTKGDEVYKERMANSVWKIRRINEYERYAKEARTCKFIEKVSALAPVHKITKCQAINMNNRPCQFKAVCGKFCKKHKVDEEAVFGKNKSKVKLGFEYSDSDSDFVKYVLKAKAVEDSDSDSEEAQETKKKQIDDDDFDSEFSDSD